MSHDELVMRAERWLKTMGCGVVFNDKFRAANHSGEEPDAIGWRDGLSLLVECKASRSDFLADRKKRFRRDPADGMGDWRFMMCPPGMIAADELPEGWGLLYVHPRKVEKVHGVPANTQWWISKPFEANKRSETQLMYSALRRLSIRGHFESIYEPLSEVR
ncbi:hypothetical protein [Chromohalobacter sp. 296-RDG]|uniref:hypothetical protein n=1 Tax=Chromohalobacter sp. 296-RDG TaxID=2994062 RepID=UPI00246946A3|nr:hypothetical protein [Chromohalobacter sp. 296-RDG]